MKTISIAFGSAAFPIRLPDRADVLELPPTEALPDPRTEIYRALHTPIGSASLAERIRCREPRNAVIVVSDNTRPVPLKGRGGILEPILDILRNGGVARSLILVATGTHRPLSNAELEAMLPPGAFAADLEIVNHDARRPEALRTLGRTTRGTEASVNARYLDADLKILTGLVEPHFMAGFSGGRKSICPGLVGMEATHIFHGAEMMMHPRADSLVLDGNPCHEEALEVARMAGCDFLVNVTIDRREQLTAVFCGDMEAAHIAACDRARETNAIPIAQTYDVVVTHAGFAGINHYQAAKAACEAAKAVTPGGTIILAANHTDVHPVGGPDYRHVLPLLKELGTEEVNRRLCSPGWTFVPEQWEVQKWAQLFAHLGPAGKLIYCAPRLTGKTFTENRVPGIDGGKDLPTADDPGLAAAMVQRALDNELARNPAATVAVLADGPYGVPVRSA